MAWQLNKDRPSPMSVALASLAARPFLPPRYDTVDAELGRVTPWAIKGIVSCEVDSFRISWRAACLTSKKQLRAVSGIGMIRVYPEILGLWGISFGQKKMSLLALFPANSLTVLGHISRHLKQMCWKCGNKQPTAVLCGGCGALQPVSRPTNYFKLMGISETYSIDLKKLKQRYNMLQARIHPDVIGKEVKAPNAPPGLLQLAESLSSEVNHAHDVLKDDMRRAEYIASLYNISAAAAPPALLIDQMVLRDQISSFHHKKNTTKLFEMRQALNKRFSDCSRLFGKALAEKDSKQMASLLCEMRFLTSTLDELKGRMNTLDVED